VRLDDAKLGQMADNYTELDAGTGNDEHLAAAQIPSAAGDEPAVGLGRSAASRVRSGRECRSAAEQGRFPARRAAADRASSHRRRLRLLCRRRRVLDWAGIERRREQPGIVGAALVVQVAHRGLDVGVPHPRLNLND
jgi:hypothetical protein